MSYAIRERSCRECGARMVGRYPPTAPVRCAECGIKALIANSLAMHNKSGTGYDRWQNSAGPRGRPRKSVGGLPIMVMPSANDAAQRWAQNFGASGARWAAGVNGVTVAPGQLAARAKQLWVTNTTAAADRFAANSARVTLQDWQQQTVSKGQPRLASGAQAAQPKVEQVFAKLFPFIQNTVNALPPRGDIEANINRAAQFARAMHTYRTQG